MKRILSILLLLPALALGQVTTNPGVTGVFTGPIPGVINGSSAATGFVGEYVETVVASASQVALVNSTAKTVASITLTAGDWDVAGFVVITGAATTNTTILIAGVSLTTNTLPADEERAVMAFSAAGTVPFPNGNISLTPRRSRFNLSSSATIYLIAYSSFSVSTAAAYGSIGARRVR